jgi:endonuclease/exonuclease/phosphatase (EEP) superfamily protein YafD
VRRAGLALLALTAAGVLGATLLAALPWFPLTLFEHFRVHYIVLALFLAAVALVCRAWASFDAAAIALWLNVGVLAAALGGPGPAPAPGAVPLRILSLNVHTTSSHHGQVAQLIAALDPDVVALTEVDHRWLDALAPALAGYAGRVEHPRSDNFGIALYHRIPLARAEVVEPGGGLPTIVAELASPAVTVVVTHPIPPISSDNHARHARQLDAIATLVRARAGPRVVLGDLNATPWSRAFQRLVRRSGLRDSLEDRRPHHTYPTAAPWLGIPIDHALVSPDIAVVVRRVEREVGSDHWPLYLELAINPPR